MMDSIFLPHLRATIEEKARARGISPRAYLRAAIGELQELLEIYQNPGLPMETALQEAPQALRLRAVSIDDLEEKAE